MIQESLKAEVAQRALDLCRSRIESNSFVAPLQMLESIKAQLEWLVSYFEGRNNERAKLRELTFGHYAVRELDEQDSEFVSALTKAYYVASKTADGVKVDESLLREGS